MQKIANYKCDISASGFLTQHFKVENIETEFNPIFDHEILIWNNNYPLSCEQLQSFPKLKMLIAWCVENKNIACEDELKKRSILFKKMDVLLNLSYDKKTQEAYRIKSNLLTFYLKKYILKTPNTIYLVRHGETQWNKKNIFQGRLDSPLTKNGIEGSLRIAHFFENKEIRHVFSSPLGRALETAKIIANQLNAKLIIIPEFEEMHFGSFQGKKTSTIEKKFAEFFVMRKQIPYNKLFVPYPQGENYLDVYFRVIKPLMSLLSNYEDFVIVGHESINRILRGIIEEQPLEKMINLRQKNNQMIKIDVKAGAEEEIIA